ncbi:MAG: hypothetical protein ACYSR3_14010 [Planctomycetota bacterium]|jgi:hypothetical protein
MPQVPILISGRISFDKVGQIAEQMSNIDYPVELALPYKYSDWNDIADYDEMLEELDKMSLDINAIHATHGKIYDETFLEWGRQTIKVADFFDAKAITIHPNNVKQNRVNMQIPAKRYIKQLQRETAIVIALETFTNSDRLFLPEEIIQNKIPMTLDMSHIANRERINEIKYTV